MSSASSTCWDERVGETVYRWQSSGLLQQPRLRAGLPFFRTTFKAESSAFEIVKRRDVTPDIRKTLEIADLWVEKILLGGDIMTEKFRDRNPFIWKILKWLFGAKYEKAIAQRVLIDADRFTIVKKYEFFLFQLGLS